MFLAPPRIWRLALLCPLFSLACSETPPATQGGTNEQGNGDGDLTGEGDGDGDLDGLGDGDRDVEGDGDGDVEGSGDGDQDHATGGDCALGEAGSFATDESLDLFGDVIYFAKGQMLPKGRYRVAFEDGCMKYNAVYTWTVNSVLGGTDGWWLVGESISDRVLLLPGKGGLLPPDGFGDFEECVNANKALAPKEFEFEGGKLGIYLNDAPYNDNLAGQGGRNPKWKLTLLGECPPDLVLL